MMDYYECDNCNNVWPDYEPKACPFCFSDEFHAIGIGMPEDDTVSTWQMMSNDKYGDCIDRRQPNGC